MVRLLLSDAKFDDCYRNSSPLVSAMQAHNYDIVEVLLDDARIVATLDGSVLE